MISDIQRFVQPFAVVPAYLDDLISKAALDIHRFQLLMQLCPGLVVAFEPQPIRYPLDIRSEHQDHVIAVWVDHGLNRWVLPAEIELAIILCDYGVGVEEGDLVGCLKSKIFGTPLLNADIEEVALLKRQTRFRPCAAQNSTCLLPGPT